MTPQSRTRTQAHSRRAGFTLIELMIVILIIAILIALAFPAINAVLRNARITSAKAEMASIRTGIANFEAEFGKAPPSYLSFVTDASGNLPAATKATLRSMFPQIQFTTVLNDSLDDAGLLGKELYGSEALVFFLGGVRRNNSGTFTNELTGFSKNPGNPFLQPTADQSTRVGPFTEFDASRLGEVKRTPNADGVSLDVTVTVDDPETAASEFTGEPLAYLDNLEKLSPRPLLYLSTARTKSYVATDSGLIVPGTAWTDYPWVPYQKSSGSFYEPNSFQLISPGSDGAYGVGGVVVLGKAVGDDADNLANFHDDALGG